MMQTWCGLTFLHWRYPEAVIAARVPASLAVDVFDGSAWVSVTPFVLKDLHLPFLPALPWISHFPETNCRTYVRGPDGKPGVWFFSLDAARAMAVAGARLAYGLPYAWSEMRVRSEGRRMRYESDRKWPERTGRTSIGVEWGEPIEAHELELFLTARFRLYSVIAGRLFHAEVDHAPWPLNEARVLKVEQTLTRCAGLPDPDGPPLAHFSRGVRVRVGAPLPAHAGRG